MSITDRLMIRFRPGFLHAAFLKTVPQIPAIALDEHRKALGSNSDVKADVRKIDEMFAQMFGDSQGEGFHVSANIMGMKVRIKGSIGIQQMIKGVYGAALGNIGQKQFGWRDFADDSRYLPCSGAVSLDGYPQVEGTIQVSGQGNALLDEICFASDGMAQHGWQLFRCR